MAVLESDQRRPANKRPTFVYRYLTGLQQMELADAMDILDQATSGRKAFESVFENAATCLISWRNIFDENGKAIPFDAKKLSHVVGLTEANELIQMILSQSPSALDKKKFASRSRSDTGQSKAADDVAARKSAKTSPTN